MPNDDCGQVPIGPLCCRFPGGCFAAGHRGRRRPACPAPRLRSEASSWLGQQGYRVLRVWSNEVLTNTEGVLEVIRRSLPK